MPRHAVLSLIVLTNALSIGASVALLSDGMVGAAITGIGGLAAVAILFFAPRARVPVEEVEENTDERTVSEDADLQLVGQVIPGFSDVYREIHEGHAHGYLLVVGGPDRARGVAIVDQPITIGRADDVTLTLTDRAVSQNHAKVEFVDGQAFASDVDSRNGTYVNADRITKCELKNCDILSLGSTKILVALPVDDSVAGESGAVADPDRLNGTMAMKSVKL